MTKIPPFEVGLLNLWICSVLLFFIPWLIALTTGTNWSRALTIPKMSVSEKVIYYSWIGISYIIPLYAIFVPIVLHPAWFYPGLALYAVGLTAMCYGTYTYQTAPMDSLITGGLYKISRNPGYFSSFLCYIGMGLLGAAWPLLAFGAAFFILYQITVKYEERMCQELWPEQFPKYRDSIAKNFLFF